MSQVHVEGVDAYLQGGGGYGPPADRDAALIARDVEAGKMSGSISRDPA